MIKLTPPHYAKADPLLRKVPFNTLFARVVIENKVDGQVYVDDYLNPTVCLIIHKYGMAFLCGNYENDSFNDQLVKFLKDTPWNQFPAKYMLTYPEQWGQKLASLLDTELLLADNLDSKENHHDSSQFFLQTQRVNYKFNPQFLRNNINLPTGFTLKRIDADLYHKIQGSVVPVYFWDSAEDFLANGIGFTLLYNDKIVSTTFSSYIVDDQLELGVETTENFRKRGLAIYAATAMISYCLANGYEPVWACRQDNIGSSRLAESLGFVPASYHPYYCMPTR